jgi:hypothetical protein
MSSKLFVTMMTGLVLGLFPAEKSVHFKPVSMLHPPTSEVAQ